MAKRSERAVGAGFGRIFMGVMLLMVGFSVSASVRAPAVAGAFYSGSPDELRNSVEKMLRAAGPFESKDKVVALVVPHAGYTFSGATAAEAFRTLEGARVRRIVLVGPSHRMAFSGGALPRKGVTAFRTPLGDVPLDLEAVKKLRASKVFEGPASAHDGEHCLEVEIPFMQVVAPQAQLIPILIGVHTDRDQLKDMAQRLSGLMDAGTVVVVSTDFTHHGEGYRWAPFPQSPGLGDRLLSLGRATADLVAAGESAGFWHQVETSGDTVCGRHPVSVLLEMVEHGFEGAGEVMDVTTSGHVLGDFAQSVTYASVVFSGRWRDWKESEEVVELGKLDVGQEEMILDLARATLKTHLGHGPDLAQWFRAYGERKVLRAPSGAFVTLHHADVKPGLPGRLRACMGVMDASRPLVDAVIQAGVSAAHDPRFPAMKERELEDLNLEVSILSPRRRVGGYETIKVGLHGVVLSKNGRSAVFLPQVAVEQGWDRETMLSHLARKAGLSADAWRSGAQFEVFTAQVVEEHRKGSGSSDP
ncbi:MAG: AmmeMemoRadiSam system protein B [Thermoanaerobaculales bacterium]|nr:AmmeMemoRadiSam system protein B [Thermoanaerobaculales bacterium]